ncbi:MAG: nucleotidyltransferase domain-containing protein [Campylobacterota bacterium]|nr:nucleotidyltransferase domain-containing protein [Campylobacterota bacterium]
MRLKQYELNSIKNIVKSFFSDAKIYIFGSQTDDAKRGGDIDIYIVSKEKENLLSKKANIVFLLESKLLKPIDILIHQDFTRAIEQEALKGVEIG